MARAAAVNIATKEAITIEEVKRDAEVMALLEAANQQLKAKGFTEHGQRHASLVGNIAHNILSRLGHGERTAELAEIASYLHDVGNAVHRENHAQIGALLAKGILSRLGMEIKEVTVVMGAIGNHEEGQGDPVSEVSAALIIADKADVHRTRVQNPDRLAFDIHDRVNYAVTKSFVRVDGEQKTITLELEVDTQISSVMDYFEIFTSRMLMAHKAAKFLGCQFALSINGTKML
ncbi:MAG: HD domain-containing protein [Chloroflexi bacterium]|nr:HD domain-containing protein [Chloroflexota bacterium]